MKASTDIRQGLGVRPGRIPELRLNLGDDLNQDSENGPAPSPFATKQSPTLRDFSLPLQRRGSTSPTAPRSPSLGVGEFQARLKRATARPRDTPNISSEPPKGLYESQKLLSHVLDRLENRRVPPDDLERACSQARNKDKAKNQRRRSSAGGVSQAVVGVAQSGISSAEVIGNGNRLKDGDLSQVWDMRETCGLVEQLRDLLLLADKQGLHLLQSSITDRQADHGARLGSATRHNTSYRSDPRLRQPTLRERIAAILHSLVSIDCHYQVSSFGPATPPNILQAMTLDIATYLYHTGSDMSKLETAETMLDGVYAFKEGMKERLYEWLKGRMGHLLRSFVDQGGGSVLQEHHLDPTTASGGTEIPFLRVTQDQPNSSPLPTPGTLNSPDKYLAQSEVTLRTSSLVVRLLSAICDMTKLEGESLITIYRTHRLLVLLLSAKPTASLDLLRIVAYSAPTSRLVAMSTLTTYYPLVMGHNVIARRPPDLSYLARRTQWETGRTNGPDIDKESHYYIHWRVSSSEPSIRPSPTCTICEGAIHGFCLKCTLCGDIQHLDCYQASEGVFQYDVVDISRPNAPPTAVSVKFSRQLPSLEEKLVAGTRRTTKHSATYRQIGDHELHRVHLFTSTPCQVCLKPIWASPSSVYACVQGCQAFYHSSCIGHLANEDLRVCQPLQTWPVARFQTTIAALYDSYREAEVFCIGDPAIQQYSYDEIAVLYGALWSRYQTLKAGLVSRTLLISSNEPGSDPLKLRPFLRSYEDFMTAQSSTVSGALADFGHIYDFDGPVGQGYLFSDAYLAYIAALLKSPDPVSGDGSMDIPSKQSIHAALPLEAVRDALRYDLAISHDAPAEFLLRQLELSGLIRRSPSRTPSVSFDAPLLAESSPAVEILVEGIAACLDSLDLSMVEQSLILLTNRAWPSLLCTPHALGRLGSVVVGWVASEDDVLHRIIREYASHGRQPPGLRAVYGVSTSPLGPVQLYKEARNGLLRRYIQPWLGALLSQDPELYTQILYEECRAPTAEHVQGDAAGFANTALDRLVSLVDAGIASSCLLELMVAWLDDLGILADTDAVFKSIPRLLSRHLARPPGTVTHVDIFSLAVEIASTSAEGFARASRFIRVLACSGADVPWQTIRTFIELGQQDLAGQNMESKLDMAIAIQSNVAYLESRELADLCGSLMVHHVGSMKRHEAAAAGSLNERYLLLLLHLVLVAYGVPEKLIQTTTLRDERISARSTQGIGAKAQARRSAMVALSGIPVDEAVVLAAIRVLQVGTQARTPVLDFLWLLLTQSSAASNVDETVYSLAPVMYEVLWPLVDLDLDRKFKTRLLLKILSVTPTPLESIITSDRTGPHRQRTIERLLKFILELCDDSTTPQALTWRSCVTELSLLLLTAISDPLHCDTASMAIGRSLLPAHLQSISLSCEASLMAGSDERRVNLLVRLRRLGLAFPSWPIISWAFLDELLTETVLSIKQTAPGKSSQNVFALLDSQNVRFHLIALGLDMLSAGIHIPYILAQRFQQHVAALCALPWAEPSEGLMDIVLPSLRNVLDSPQQMAMSSTHDVEAGLASKKKMAVVGSLFVPSAIELGSVLADKQMLLQRCLLDILLIIYHKHNVTAVLHPALKTLQNVAAFIQFSDCADNRLLGLAIVQAALDRMQRQDLVRVVPAVFLALSTTMCAEGLEGGRTAIDHQCGVLLRRMIKMFGRAGVLLDILRLDATKSPSSLTGSVFAKALLRLYPDTGPSEASAMANVILLVFEELPDILKRGRSSLDQVLASLEGFVPAVQNSISPGAVDAFGSFLGKLGKHVAEWTSMEFDPEQILLATSTILEVVKGEQAMAFPSQVATFLNLCLSRFDVSEKAIRSLTTASYKLCVRAKVDDVIRIMIHDFAVSAAQGLDVSLMTLSTLLEYATATASISPVLDEDSKLQLLHSASAGCIQILLRRHPTLLLPRQDPRRILEALNRASAVLLRAERQTTGTLSEVLIPVVIEPPQHQISIFTSLLLASMNIDLGRDIASIVHIYPVLAGAITSTLRQVGELFVRQDAEAASLGAELLSSVLVAVRLAFLAIHAGSGGVARGGSSDERVLDVFWMDIGSEWVRLISLSINPLCTNTPLRGTIHSVFLDTVLFLTCLRPLEPSTGVGIHTGLDHLLRHAEETGNGGGKLLRAVDAVKSGHPGMTGRIEREKLLDSVKADMAATEKLRFLRSDPFGT